MSYELSSDAPVEVYPEPALRRFTVEFLAALGATEEEASLVADGLITASLFWHPGQGQGLEKLIRYHRRVANGGIVPGASMTWVKEGPAYALLDAARGFGYVAAHRAMGRAVEKARESGVAWVGVRNSNHFGIAGYHALQAAGAGFIGWAMTNAGAEMAPFGSAKRVLGTNPWGIAVPRRSSNPLLLDMALTQSGKGMMRWSLRAGSAIPETWALTPQGQKTSDPAEAMDGPLLPVGGYKGYGLSLVTDILTGVMTGALFGLSVFQEDRHYDVGHALIALNPGSFMPREEFEARLEKLLAEVKGAPPIDPLRPVMLPGEAEFRRMEERLRDGIPVDASTVRRLEELAGGMGVPPPGSAF
jgi:LDH2 family malate/lactate/ureidoglycolate dehydrogenase